ncbi:MAG: hypothetical protein AB8F94_23100 [Saprospiraceae bacterium]
MKITSSKQILENCTWGDSNHLAFNLYSEILKKSFLVTLFFDPKKEKKEIREETIKSIIEFQNITEKDIEDMQNAMWEFVKKYKSEDDRIDMGIENKKEAIAKSQIAGVGFINEDEIDHTFFQVFMNVKWDIEHGVTIFYYHGKLDDVQ